MTFTPSSIEIAFLWNMQHGLLGQPAQDYITSHPDHEDALLRIFRLGGNELVKDLLESGADVTAFQPTESDPLTPLTAAESLLIYQLRDGETDAAAETLAKLLTPAPTTWRDRVVDVDHYLLAFGIAGALVRNHLVDVDVYTPNWHRTFEHLVSTVEDALNALDQ